MANVLKLLLHTCLQHHNRKRKNNENKTASVGQLATQIVHRRRRRWSSCIADQLKIRSSSSGKTVFRNSWLFLLLLLLSPPLLMLMLKSPEKVVVGRENRRENRTHSHNNKQHSHQREKYQFGGDRRATEKKTILLNEMEKKRECWEYAAYKAETDRQTDRVHTTIGDNSCRLLAPSVGTTERHTVRRR